MTIKEVLKKYSNIEIELLLAHVLDKTKEFIFLHPEQILSPYHFNILSLLVKRRMDGKPLAYILGYKDFCGLRFKVTPDVLIPRPETEELVHKVYQVCKVCKDVKSIKILDLATGSGCIAISLAKSVKGRFCQITASDISAKALTTAKQNAKEIFTKHYHTILYDSRRPKIKFVRSDLFQHIRGKFDVVVANLPYIPAKTLRKLMDGRIRLPTDDPFAGLKYEPVFALTDSTNSWQIYRRFFEQVGGHINPGGKIFLEIDPASRKFLTDYQKKYLPGGQIKFYRDFNNFWRYAEIQII